VLDNRIVNHYIGVRLFILLCANKYLDLGCIIIITPNCQTLYHTALYEPSLQGADPWSQVGTLVISRSMPCDLGSVSTGYSDRPVARAIKIKHAGLNLTGRVVQLVLDAMRDTR
jgi:hypothetical protein